MSRLGKTNFHNEYDDRINTYIMKKWIKTITKKLAKPKAIVKNSPWARNANKELSEEESVEIAFKIALRRLIAGNLDEIWLEDGTTSSHHNPLLEAHPLPFNIMFMRDDGIVMAAHRTREKALYKKYKKRFIAWSPAPMKRKNFRNMDTYNPNRIDKPTKSEIEVIRKMMDDIALANTSNTEPVS